MNCTEYPIASEWANELIKYFDLNYPKVAELLSENISDCPSPIYIITTSNDCRAHKKDKDKIIFTPNEVNTDCIKRGNNGFLIHEATHVIQNYDNDTYIKNKWIAEAMADYIRAKLDNNFNEYPCGNCNNSFGSNGTQCSKCGAEFFTWIENNKPGFIVQLNKELKDKKDGTQFICRYSGKRLVHLYRCFRNL